jgi:hypothetical protein
MRHMDEYARRCALEKGRDEAAFREAVLACVRLGGDRALASMICGLVRPCSKRVPRCDDAPELEAKCLPKQPQVWV